MANEQMDLEGKATGEKARKAVAFTAYEGDYRALLKLRKDVTQAPERRYMVEKDGTIEFF